jgi:hypothetical protein
MPRGHQKGQHCKWREFLDRSRSRGGDPPHALLHSFIPAIFLRTMRMPLSLGRWCRQSRWHPERRSAAGTALGRNWGALPWGGGVGCLAGWRCWCVKIGGGVGKSLAALFDAVGAAVDAAVGAEVGAGVGATVGLAQKARPPDHHKHMNRVAAARTTGCYHKSVPARQPLSTPHPHARAPGPLAGGAGCKLPSRSYNLRLQQDKCPLMFSRHGQAWKGVR